MKKFVFRFSKELNKASVFVQVYRDLPKMYSTVVYSRFIEGKKTSIQFARPINTYPSDVIINKMCFI